MRTEGTGSGTWMLGADSIFVRIPIIVRRRLANAVSIVAFIIKTQLIAALIQVLYE